VVSTTCPICATADVERMSTAVGERAYCKVCFHGWRVDHPGYAYSKTAMCALGTSEERLQRQIRFFAPFAPVGAAILEIGCATGELAAATRRTLDVARYEAIELSPAGRHARPNLDKLYDQPLRRLLGDGKIRSRFDVILMSHVIEHLEDPAAELMAMKRVLAAGGAIFLEVPNGAGNRRLPLDDNRAHLHFFSLASMTRMLAAAGLDAVAAATDVRLDARYGDSLQVIARPFHAPGWSRTLLSDHPAIAGERDIVVWGAGSLAEELLANFFDRDRIAFFIDRDSAKQQGLCLGRPVRPPECLGNAPRTVLINSIDFADSIIGDITQRFPDVGHRLVRISDLLS
jgi:SAM-dependent methyltransferase